MWAQPGLVLVVQGLEILDVDARFLAAGASFQAADARLGRGAKVYETFRNQVGGRL
jgi:hypothetical protein